MSIEGNTDLSSETAQITEVPATLLDEYMEALASGDEDWLRDCENRIEAARSQ